MSNLHYITTKSACKCTNAIIVYQILTFVYYFSYHIPIRAIIRQYSCKMLPSGEIGGYCFTLYNRPLLPKESTLSGQEDLHRFSDLYAPGLHYTHGSRGMTETAPPYPKSGWFYLNQREQVFRCYESFGT